MIRYSEDSHQHRKDTIPEFLIQILDMGSEDYF